MVEAAGPSHGPCRGMPCLQQYICKVSSYLFWSKSLYLDHLLTSATSIVRSFNNLNPIISPTMPFYSAALFSLAIVMPFAHVQADSALFSQFIGATTASHPSSGGGISFIACTNYLRVQHGLTDLPPESSTQIKQQIVDGVCYLCTGLEQSRIDSCCPQATSSACFDQFDSTKAATTTPASAVVKPTATSADVKPTATSAGGSGLTPTSTSNAGVIAKVRPLYMVVIDTKALRTWTSLPVPLSQSWSAASLGGCYRKNSSWWA